MTTQHTPGPWVARPDPNAFLADDWCVGIGDSLANIDKVAVCSERDAHLIAAAPELLDALRQIRNSAYMPRGLIGTIDMVIAKATGGAA